MVEALTVNANFLRPKGVRLWLWGDMFDPDQNGRHLDMSGAALLARLPKDLTILDWKYDDVLDGEADFASVGLFTRHGLSTIGSPWFKPGNVAAMAASVHRYGADGMIQTSWNTTNPPHMKCELERALALTARLTWSPADTNLARLTTIPEAPFADITDLPDGELMRRVRIDLTARAMADVDQHPAGADLLPVQRSIAFEEARVGLGLSGALAAGGGTLTLAGDYAALGAAQVAACLHGLSASGPEADRAVQQALQQAGMQQRRAAWVRAHAAAFAADRCGSCPDSDRKEPSLTP